MSLLSPVVYTSEGVKAVRYDSLRLPLHICLGRFEAATEGELDELIADAAHELDRRAPA